MGWWQLTGANFPVPDFGLQFFQKVQRLKRRKCVDVGLRQTIEDALRERSEHGELQRGFRLHSNIMLLRTLVQTQYLTGTQNNRRGQAGQACDVVESYHVFPISGIGVFLYYQLTEGYLTVT